MARATIASRCRRVDQCNCSTFSLTGWGGGAVGKKNDADSDHRSKATRMAWSETKAAQFGLGQIALERFAKQRARQADSKVNEASAGQ